MSAVSVFRLRAKRVYIRNFARTLFIFPVLLTKRPDAVPPRCGGEEVVLGQLNISSKCHSVLQDPFQKEN